MKKIEDPASYIEGCDKFKDYKDINEYIEDVKICLVYSSWHYSEERATDRIKNNMRFVKEDYEKKVPANDDAMDIGYSCG